MLSRGGARCCQGVGLGVVKGWSYVLSRGGTRCCQGVELGVVEGWSYVCVVSPDTVV